MKIKNKTTDKEPLQPKTPLEKRPGYWEMLLHVIKQQELRVKSPNLK